MRRRMEEGDASSAQKILDTMEIKRIKNMSDLSLIAEVYAENERYEEALQLYLRIYEKTKSRKSLFQLVDLNIKLRKAEEAERYLRDYEKLAAKDFYKYILRYKIERLKGESYETLIETLETLKNTEYMEKWAYELAKTYYKAGREKECIQECSDIILWFGEGTYVEKAKLLRSYYSGEADKAKIMEELKRRAMEDTGRNFDTEKVKDAEESLMSKELQESVAVTEEEEVYSATDFNVEEETADFENDLKKDIRIILTEEVEDITEMEEMLSEELSEGEYSEGEYSEGEYSEEEYSEEEFTEEEHKEWEEHSLIEELSDGEPDYNSSSMFSTQYLGTEREVAEQEVENAIYQLLEEEDMDEDDKKLKLIAEDLQIDLDEVFGNFLHVNTVKKQLVKSLEVILDENTKTVQLLITGTDGSGKTTLAKDITMLLYKTGKLKTSKIAKIKADKLNSIDIMAKKDTLKDCCLVVENASELRRETIDSLLELCRMLRGNIAVIFEENKKNINKLFRECPKLMDLFKNRIHLPGYSVQDLMGFAIACLRQKDYRLNSKAEPILIHKINQIAKQSEPHMHLEQIYNLMQATMDAADVRTGKQLSNLASQGRLRDVEILTILSEDLMIKP
jgi:energy-coupling factor transporter ATP-binding protein EcfA2